MGSNIAPLINETHAKVERARQAVVEHAVECGRLLNEAKATVAHGKWQDWLTANCKFSARTAQLYMRAFKQLSTDPAKAQRVADFSLRQLDSYLADLDREDGSERGAKKPSEREQRDVLMDLWYGATPAARREFMYWLRDKGDVDDACLERVLLSLPSDVQSAALAHARKLDKRFTVEQLEEYLRQFQAAMNEHLRTVA